jgi:predicted alpha/beta superfamily hydrolase
MRFTLTFLFLLCSTLIKAQDNSRLPGKRIDTIHSAILNEDRFIWVHVPDKTPVVSRFPVIYLLDGQILFDEFINILNLISKESGKNLANEMVVVGIGNIWQRYRDYSPTHISFSPWVDSHSAATSGGGEKFIAFLQDELFPYIHAKYPDSSLRILMAIQWEDCR